MPRRVLHFITELNVGGAERLLVEVLPHLDPAKIESQAAYLHGDAPLAGELERRGIRVHALHSWRKFDPRPAWQLARLLERERIDILHTHLIQADIFGFWAVRMAVTPLLVSTKHNVHYHERRERWLRPVMRRIERRTDVVVAISNAVAGEYPHARRLEVIHNGVDCSRFTPLPLPATGPVVCVASLKQQKGHRVLLEAFARLAPESPDLRLELAGDGPMFEELQARAVRLGLMRKVEFLGPVPDVRPLLARASLAVLPSLWEGLGLALMEAMATGRPVIASDVDGIREIVTSEQDGLLVPAGDVSALATAMRRLLRDRELAQRLATAGRERIVQAFSIEQMARKLERLYETLTRAS